MISEKTLFSWLIFCIAFPPVKIIVNMSFLVFTLILVLKWSKVGYKSVRLDMIDKMGILFTVFIFISSLTTKNQQAPILTSLHFNHIYWLGLFVYLRRIPQEFFPILVKSVFYGLVFLSFTYFVPLPKLDGFVVFPVIRERNVFTYQLVLLVPLAVQYIKGHNWQILFSFVFTIIALATDGRTGSVLVMIGVLPILISHKRILVLLVLAIVSILYLESFNGVLQKAAPRLYSTLSSGDLKDDTSWLYRMAMVQKGLIIVRENPYVGSGLSSWRSYKVDSGEMLNSDVFDRIRNKSTNWSNISPHNSYIQILAEQGYIGFVIWLVFLTAIFFKAWIIYNQKKVWVIGLLTMLIYLYVISSYQSSITFLILALASNRKL